MAKRKIMTAKRLKKRKLRRALWIVSVIAFALTMGQYAEKINAAREASADSQPIISADYPAPAVKENKDEQKISESSTQELTSDFIVKVKSKDGEIIEQNLEEYVSGVLAAEMPVNFALEALKAQAVATRSYCIYYLGKNDYIPAGVSAQDWLSEEEQRERWGDNYENYRQKIVQAAAETKGEVLLWQDSVIEAVYHASCGGYKTAAAADVWGGYIPYLQSVDCPHGEDKHSKKENHFSRAELAESLGAPAKGEIKITAKDASGRVAEITVGGEAFQGSEVRSALGLPSTVFTVKTKGDEVIITTDGSGHGVGMCQYGANYYALEGWDYKQILAHFYQETELGKV